MNDTTSEIMHTLTSIYRSAPTGLTLLAEGEKVVARAHLPGAGDWIVRLYPTAPEQPHPAARLAGLLASLEMRGYPAERVVRAAEGDLTVPSAMGEILVTRYLGPPLQPWQGASAPASEDTGTPADHDPALLRRIGALLARLHTLDEGWPAGGLSPAGEVAWGLKNLTEARASTPTELQGEYAYLERRLRQIRAFDSCPRALTHGDCHLGNIVVAPDLGPVLVDWEAAGAGAAVADLGQLLSDCSDPRSPELNGTAIDAIMDGYHSVRPLTPIERDLLPDAISFRVLVTLACAFEERCSPSFQPDDRLWGATYAEWQRHERRAAQIAERALRRADLAS